MERLSVTGTLDSLGLVVAFVQGAAAAARLEREDACRLSLAVDEIVTNIITHGYAQEDREDRVDLRVEVDDDTVAISIEDSGPAFDPLQHPLPDGLDQPQDQRGVGGLGIYLVLRSVDEFLYERVGDRNRNTLIMYRPTQATAVSASDMGPVSRGKQAETGAMLIDDQEGEARETTSSGAAKAVCTAGSHVRDRALGLAVKTPVTRDWTRSTESVPA